MSLLVCRVDKTLRIAKDKSSFPNKGTLIYEFKAGVPLEVIPEVAKAYSEAYPHVYQVVTSEKKIEDNKGETKEEVKTSAPEFDPIAYLKANPSATEDQLKLLKHSELLSVCETLELKAYSNTGVPKLISMIVQELAVRNSE